MGCRRKVKTILRLKMLDNLEKLMDVAEMAVSSLSNSYGAQGAKE